MYHEVTFLSELLIEEMLTFAGLIRTLVEHRELNAYWPDQVLFYPPLGTKPHSAIKSDAALQRAFCSPFM